jgi:hypothetical protein
MAKGPFCRLGVTGESMSSVADALAAGIELMMFFIKLENWLLVIGYWLFVGIVYCYYFVSKAKAYISP